MIVTYLFFNSKGRGNKGEQRPFCQFLPSLSKQENLCCRTETLPAGDSFIPHIASVSIYVPCRDLLKEISSELTGTPKIRRAKNNLEILPVNFYHMRYEQRIQESCNQCDNLGWHLYRLQNSLENKSLDTLLNRIITINLRDCKEIASKWTTSH